MTLLDGDEWIGEFERGDCQWPGTFATSGPGEDWLTVVAEGSAYAVNALDPTSWFEDEEYAVVDAYSAPELGLVVFATFTEIAAYDATGLRWRSNRLSYDGLRIDAVNERAVSGVGWNAPTGSLLPFEVDLASGSVVRAAYR